MNVGYAVSALFAMILVVFTGVGSGRLDIKDAVNLRFIHLTRYIGIYCVLDSLWGLFYSGALVSELWFRVVCYVLYTMAGVTTFMWFQYMLHYMQVGARSSLLLRSASAIFLIFEGMILITNYFTHDVFYINSHGIYHSSYGRTNFQLIISLTYGLMLAYGLYRLAVTRGERRRKTLVATICAVLPGIFGAGQILFIDVPMYSFGFVLILLIIFIFGETRSVVNYLERHYKAENVEQLALINGVAGNFSTVYSVDMETGGFIIYNRTGDENFLKKVDNSNLDYFKTVVTKGRRMVHKDDMEKFLLVMDKDIIKRRFEREDTFSLVLRINFGYIVKYIEYRFTLYKIDGREKLIIAVYDVDKTYRKKLKDAQTLKSVRERQAELEEETQLLDKAAHRDIMTGLYNRRAYEAYVDDLKGRPDRDDFVYVSLDVNGLKAINDDLGHEAGDELITGAAFCMKKVLGEYGSIYRHGGDEFSAILHTPEDKLKQLFEKFDEELEAYEGKLINEISVSYGWVIKSETGDITIEEMSKIADQRMYEAKNRHYAKKGIDRRGQQEAYEAIRKSYLKILKVDIKTDTFASVYMEDTEQDSKTGYNASISKWLRDFAAMGNIHPDDVDEFVKKMDLESVRSHFEQGHGNIAIHYRRKSGEGYNNALLEIIKSEKFSPDNQIVFLYVKNIY